MSSHTGLSDGVVVAASITAVLAFIFFLGTSFCILYCCCCNQASKSTYCRSWRRSNSKDMTQTAPQEDVHETNSFGDKIVGMEAESCEGENFGKIISNHHD